MCNYHKYQQKYIREKYKAKRVWKMQNICVNHLDRITCNLFSKEG